MDKKDTNHMFSSESVALDCLGYNKNVRDVKLVKLFLLTNVQRKFTYL